MITGIWVSIAIGLISAIAGLFGALLGIGGGIIIVPVLTLLLGIDIRHAAGASLVSVIATSSAAAVAFVRDRMTNPRIGMVLELATTTGAITGAWVAHLIDARWLFVLFALLLLFSAVSMFQRRKSELPADVEPHPWATRLNLHGQYFDHSLGRQVTYHTAGLGGGLLSMYVAGILSGLLGIGSGLFKVLGMDVFMKLPFKVSTATSNFMIGVTAATTAGVYFQRGDIDPRVAGPVALGVLLGATLGARALRVMRSGTLRLIFVPVLVVTALQMLMKGVHM